MIADDFRRVSAGHICFSNTLKSFVSLTADGAIPFNAEEFSDPSELRALAELIGILFSRIPRVGARLCTPQVLTASAC